MAASTFPRSHVLVLGSNSVHTLLPATLITRADALLEAHRIEDAVALAERHARGPETDDLRYVFQRLGFQCLAETLFDDAGRHLLAGALDPRVLVSYYPELCGTLFAHGEEGAVFAGVAECMPPEASIDDIITINLVRNYSPHLAPNTSTAPPTVELRRVLKLAATDMLKVFLRKWRARHRRDDDGGRDVHQVVDTVLGKLYTVSNETTDLLALIDGPNDVLLPEIEPALLAAGRYDALCRLYKARGAEEKLLDVWYRLVTGDIVDEDVSDPLGSLFAYLQDKRDRGLAQEWGVRLVRWDAERALKLLTTVGANKRGTKTSVTDDAALLEQIQTTNPAAGVQFLEYLVFQRRSQFAELHTQLASTYISQVIDCLQDEGTAKLWRAKAASFASPSSAASAFQQPQPPPSFLAYFASTTPDSPSKRTRLRALLFLQTSRLYDAAAVWGLLEPAAEDEEKRRVLALERAVVLGKLGRHRDALTTHVHTLRDSTSAEAYCALGGRGLVPAKTLLALAERYEVSVPRESRESDEDGGEEAKRTLTRVLLEVYMSGGEAMSERTARLLDAQGGNLDVLEVLPLIPPPWPLHTLTSFLTRSLRRTLHTRHETQLVKALAASESLAVVETTWGALREGGMVLEEPLDDEDADDFGEFVGGEKEVELSEKGPVFEAQPERQIRGYEVAGREEDNDDVDSVL